MKWGVGFAGTTWFVYEVATGIRVSRHHFEFVARREARMLNERGV